MNQPIDNDFVHEVVPATARQGFWRILFVWLGFVLVVGIMAVGGGLASQMPRGELIVAILVGNLVLGGMAAFSGYIGAETGVSFNVLMSYAFAGRSWRVASLFVPIVMIGWYAIESALFANYVGEVLHLSELARRGVMFLSALGFAVSAYLGFQVLGLVSFVLVPLILGLGGFAILRIATDHSAAFNFGVDHVNLATGTALVVSSWALAVLLCLPDLTRFSRNPRIGAVVGFLGIFIGNCFNFFIGAAGAGLTRQADPALILASLGFVAFGLLFSFANIWSTNDNNLYSAALHVARILAWPRKRTVVLCTVVGACIAVFNPARISFIFDTLIFMGSTGPALGGVVLGRHVIKNWMRCSVGDSQMAAWVGWIGGSVIAFLVGPVAAIPAGFFSAALLWFLGVKLFARCSPVETPTSKLQ